MKNLIPLVVLVSIFGCAAYQAKVDDAKSKAKDLKEKVDCRADVLSPYAAYITSEQFPKFLEGADISDLIEAVETVKDKVKQVKADFKACDAK